MVERSSIPERPHIQKDMTMAMQVKDVMTADPQCCKAETPLNEVANLMVENDCGQIPVVDDSNHLIGVITDRDIVCRVVAKGKNPAAVSAAECMTEPVVSVHADASLEDVLATIKDKQIRRVPVVDVHGVCCGIVSQADIALEADEAEVGEMVREVSRDAAAR